MKFHHVVLMSALGFAGWYAFSYDGVWPWQEPVRHGQAAGGFTDLPIQPHGHDDHTVYVFFHANCPTPECEHGESLVRALDQAEIPHEQISSYEIKITNDGANASDEEIARLKAKVDRMEAAMTPIREKGQPIVFINGYARSSPSAATVVAAYPQLAAR